MSLRTFDGGPAREIPCHRVNARGKRLYKREDLDRWMQLRRQVPATATNVDQLVDSVIASIGQGAK